MHKKKTFLGPFNNYVQDKDRDIFISGGDHYAKTILDFLFARMVRLGLDLYLGREEDSSTININKVNLYPLCRTNLVCHILTMKAA